MEDELLVLQNILKQNDCNKCMFNKDCSKNHKDLCVDSLNKIEASIKASKVFPKIEKCGNSKHIIPAALNSTVVISCGINKLEIVKEGQMVRYPNNFEIMNKINEIIDRFDAMAQR